MIVRIMRCGEPGCEAQWFQMGNSHEKAVRLALRMGWKVGEAGTGCPCGRKIQRCPDHDLPTA